MQWSWNSFFWGIVAAPFIGITVCWFLSLFLDEFEVAFFRKTKNVTAKQPSPEADTVRGHSFGQTDEQSPRTIQ